MFMLNNAGALATSTLPDVCNTPTPAGPVPMPYPNTADTSMTDPGGLVTAVLVTGAPALNLMSKITLSNGDQAGAQGGIVSAKIMGEAAFLTASTTVMVAGKPAVMINSQTSHNGAPQNTIGLASVPSQTQVMITS